MKVEKIETFFLSKLSLTPKRKVTSYVGRLCKEGKTFMTDKTTHTIQKLRYRNIFYLEKFTASWDNQ